MVFRSIRGHIVDVDDVAARLSADGMVVFAGADRAVLGEVLSSWSVSRAHPHAVAGALTVIEPRGSAMEPGGGGFSNAAVAPHTDRALVAHPPAVAAVLVERPASAGGQSLLVDLAADRWFRLLLRGRPAKGDVWLGGADGARWAVVESKRGVARVRFRDDEVARPERAGVYGHVMLGRVRALTARPLVLRLGPGEGYLVHNHRVLHGRAAFVGYRRVVRLLADVRPGHRFAWLNDGFAVGR